MSLYNIRIINVGRNIYRGSIMVDSNQSIYGICTEANYDSKRILVGSLKNEGIYIEIICQESGTTYPILAKKTDLFPQKSIAKSTYFYGQSLDNFNDWWDIEITNVKDIENKLKTEANKKLQLIKK